CVPGIERMKRALGDLGGGRQTGVGERYRAQRERRDGGKAGGAKQGRNIHGVRKWRRRRSIQVERTCRRADAPGGTWNGGGKRMRESTSLAMLQAAESRRRS